MPSFSSWCGQSPKHLFLLTSIDGAREIHLDCLDVPGHLASLCRSSRILPRRDRLSAIHPPRLTRRCSDPLFNLTRRLVAPPATNKMLGISREC